MSGVIVKDGIGPAMQALAKEFPTEFPKALKDFGARWRRILSVEMKAGNPNGRSFAPLSPMTVALKRGKIVTIRRANRRKGTAKVQIAYGKAASARLDRRKMRQEGIGKDSKRWKKTTRALSLSRGFGGVLSQLDEYQSGEAGLSVGWLGIIFAGANRANARWQRKEQRAWTTAERRKWHQIWGDNIPEAMFSRPARPPVSPQEPRFVSDAKETITKSVKARVASAARFSRRSK